MSKNPRDFGLPGVPSEIREIWGQKAGEIAGKLDGIFKDVSGMSEAERQEYGEVMGIVVKMLGQEKVARIKKHLEANILDL